MKFNTKEVKIDGNNIIIDSFKYSRNQLYVTLSPKDKIIILDERLNLLVKTKKCFTDFKDLTWLLSWNISITKDYIKYSDYRYSPDVREYKVKITPRRLNLLKTRKYKIKVECDV